jgi:hypothetical protein
MAGVRAGLVPTVIGQGSNEIRRSVHVPCVFAGVCIRPVTGNALVDIGVIGGDVLRVLPCGRSGIVQGSVVDAVVVAGGAGGGIERPPGRGRAVVVAIDAAAVPAPIVKGSIIGLERGKTGTDRARTQVDGAVHMVGPKQNRVIRGRQMAERAGVGGVRVGRIGPRDQRDVVLRVRPRLVVVVLVAVLVPGRLVVRPELVAGVAGDARGVAGLAGGGKCGTTTVTY